MTQTRRRYTNGRLRRMEDLPSGGSRPSLSVAYIILSGTSCWAIKQTNPSASGQNYAFGAFGFLLGHSIIGILHTTYPDPADILKKIFHHTCILAEAAPLALLNAELYLMSGFGQEYSYAHVVSALLPTIADLATEGNTQTMIDVSLIGNMASLLYLQLSKETGVWTAGLLALTSLNNYVFKQISDKYDIPKIEIVTIGLTFFTIFGLNCLRDLKG